MVALTAHACAAFPQKIQTEARDGVFIHITHGPDEPHQVLMALRMAELMSEDNDVLVNFDIKAVEVVLKDAPRVRQIGCSIDSWDKWPQPSNSSNKESEPSLSPTVCQLQHVTARSKA